MYVLAGLLLAGLACNLAVRKLDPKWFTYVPAARARAGAVTAPTGEFNGTLVLPWLAIGVPLAWGFYQTILKASVLFR
jgi:hypothetical protein